jgi:hypothetical protein
MGGKYYWNPSQSRREFDFRKIECGDVFEMRGNFGESRVKACYDSKTGDLYLSVGCEKGVQALVSNCHSLVDEHDEHMSSVRFVDFLRIGKNLLVDILKQGELTFEDIIRADRSKVPKQYRDQFFDELSKLLEKYFEL